MTRLLPSVSWAWDREWTWPGIQLEHWGRGSSFLVKTGYWSSPLPAEFMKWLWPCLWRIVASCFYWRDSSLQLIGRWENTWTVSNQVLWTLYKFQIQEYTVIVSELAALPKDRVSLTIGDSVADCLILLCIHISCRVCSPDRPADWYSTELIAASHTASTKVNTLA